MALRPIHIDGDLVFSMLKGILLVRFELCGLNKLI